MFRDQKKLFYWLGGGLTLFFLVLYYAAYRYFGYYAAPGGDLYNHYIHLKELHEQGLSVFFQDYPKLFHAVILLGIKLSGLPALTVMLYLVPIIFVGMAWAAAFIAFLLGGWVSALLALVIVLFVSAQPLQTLYDGGFPNTIAAHIWLPILVGMLYLAIHKRKTIWIVAVVSTLFLMIATHAFTLTYALGILASLAIYYWKVGWRYFGILLILGLIFLFSPFSLPFRDIVGSVFVFQSGFPWVGLVGKLENSNAIWNFSEYPRGISYLVVWLGLVGIGFLIREIYHRTERSLLAYLVLVWVLLLGLGSQIEALGYPVRLARDLATPLVICAALGITSLWKLLSNRWWGIPRIVLILVVAWLGYAHTHDRFQRILTYEPTILYSQANYRAGEVIDDAPAVALDQYLTYSFQENIVPVELEIFPPDEQHLEVWISSRDEDRLRKADYVLYEIRTDYSGERFRPLLEKLGFLEIARFTDLRKTVVLYRQ